MTVLSGVQKSMAYFFVEKSFESALPPPPVPGALFSPGKITKGKRTEGAGLNRRRMKPARSSHFYMAAPEIPAMRSMDLFAPNVCKCL